MRRILAEAFGPTPIWKTLMPNCNDAFGALSRHGNNDLRRNTVSCRCVPTRSTLEAQNRYTPVTDLRAIHPGLVTGPTDDSCNAARSRSCIKR